MHHYEDIREALTPVEPPKRAKRVAGKAKPLKRATRQPKTTRVARTRAGGTWSEAQYWQFIRSGLRQLSRRWPPVTRLVWNESRRPYVGPNKRQRWEFQCAVCAKWYMRKEMQADHIQPCGSLKSWEDLAGFTRRLLVETAGLRILCAECHLLRTRGKGGSEAA